MLFQFQTFCDMLSIVIIYSNILRFIKKKSNCKLCPHMFLSNTIKFSVHSFHIHALCPFLVQYPSLPRLLSSIQIVLVLINNNNTSTSVLIMAVRETFICQSPCLFTVIRREIWLVVFGQDCENDQQRDPIWEKS